MNFIIAHFTLIYVGVILFAAVLGIFVGLISDATKHYPPVQDGD